MIKPRINVIDPTPDVSPGTAGGFPSMSAIAKRTPIRLRVTDDVEQPVMFFLSWKTNPQLRLDALRILDAAMRRRLFERGPVRVVLNGEQIDYADIVAAVKAEFPNLIVLRYSNAQRVPEGTRIASTMWQYLYDNRNTLTLIKNTSPPEPWIIGTCPNREFQTDITVDAARQWIAEHIAEQVGMHGTDGVLIDSFHTEVRTPDALVGGELKNDQWPDMAQDLLKRIRIELDRKFSPTYKEVWFNGLWSYLLGGQIDRQEALLDDADGATVEFYGRAGFDATSPHYPAPEEMYSTMVELINPVLQRNPTKPILVRGSVTDAYYDYVPDLQNARYAYACYLCGGWTPLSTFIFHHHFQIHRLPRSRANTVTVHSYLELPLGSPAAAAVDDGSGGLSREFDGGWAFLAPDGSGVHLLALPRDLWTARGQLLEAGTPIRLAEGDALILLKDEPPPPPYRVQATIADSDDEWLLETITGEHRYKRFRARVRSFDPASSLLLRAHTNDEPKPFLNLIMLPTGGSFAGQPGKDYAYGMDAYLGATHVELACAYEADGEWHEIDVDLARVCAASPLPGDVGPGVR